jgi:hypothetical protein
MVNVNLPQYRHLHQIISSTHLNHHQSHPLPSSITTDPNHHKSQSQPSSNYNQTMENPLPVVTTLGEFDDTSMPAAWSALGSMSTTSFADTVSD